LINLGEGVRQEETFLCLKEELICFTLEEGKLYSLEKATYSSASGSQAAQNGEDRTKEPPFLLFMLLPFLNTSKAVPLDHQSSIKACRPIRCARPTKITTRVTIRKERVIVYSCS